MLLSFIGLLLITSTMSQPNILNTLSPSQLDADQVQYHQLVKGDHIYRFGAIYKGSQLTHHGIFTGRGVVHFTGGSSGDIIGDGGIINQLESADINEDSYFKFMLENPELKCYRVRASNSLTDSERNNIVDKARSYIGKGKNFFGGYSPATNNCEHFANWCRTGERTSIQTEQIADNVGSELVNYIPEGVLDFIRSTGVVLQGLFNLVGASPTAKSVVDMGVLVTEKGLNRKTPSPPPHTSGGANVSNRTPSPSGTDIPITSGIYPNLDDPQPSAPPEPSQNRHSHAGPPTHFSVPPPAPPPPPGESYRYDRSVYDCSYPPTYDSLYN